MECEILKLIISIIGELCLWEIPEKNETQELNTSELKKKLNTQGKNSNLKEKTQNSRKKLNFSAFLESCDVKKVAKKSLVLNIPCQVSPTSKSISDEIMNFCFVSV